MMKQNSPANIEEVKKILDKGRTGVQITRGKDAYFIEYPISVEELARQIDGYYCQLFPQPLQDKEFEKAIQDILDTAITVDNECNEITKKAQILALLQRRVEGARRQGKLWGIASLTLLVAEIQSCKDMKHVNEILESWIKGNNLEPDKVETFNTVEELEQALKGMK